MAGISTKSFTDFLEVAGVTYHTCGFIVGFCSTVSGLFGCQRVTPR